MRKDELQYLSDTLLIEELASDPALVKQAGLFEDIGFDSIAKSVKEFAQKHIRADAPGGYAGSIISLMAPAIAWRIHPILGIAAAAAYALGFDVVSVAKKILSALSGDINSGNVNLSDVSSLGRDAVAAEAGDMAATDDMLLPIREALRSEAQLFGRRRPRGFGYHRGGTLPKTPWGHTKGAPLLQRIFGNLTKARGKWLVGGILVWLLKTLLVGAGLVAGAGLVKKLVSPTKKPPTAVETAPTGKKPARPTKKVPVVPVKAPDPFTPSGNGQKHFANDANNIWIVPLLNRSIDATLAAWAVDVYPALANHLHVVEMSPAFNRTVNKLKRNFNARSPNNLIMPIGLHTRKQVVDLFSRDVKKLLKG